ncbi:hypothetical protein KZI27_00110 (plasmid) [Curtobacterium sp. TC1]|uniref:glycoside hydrolase family 26 protein n=1 Tax=Curtobacterium sp. TC1 TaxID=2862880 RepID=UPI001C9B0F32|nr:glycosyl hydrolase [Curtobacterium sp. TC1]QZQ53681.1 hypothetical protein KZI27_00110 [Curtobacterium sp. TC1]
MSDIIRSSSTWWAQSSKHARWTAVGTTAIVLALALITWSVWVSPAGPVSTAVHQALGVTAPKAKKVSAAELQTQLDAAQDRIWALEGKLDSRTAQAGSRGDQITQLKAQIASLQSQLGSAKGSGGSSSVTASGSGANGAGYSGSGVGTPSGSGDLTDASAGGGSESNGGSGVAATKPNTGPSTDPGSTPVDVPTKAEILDQQSRWYGLYTAQAPFNWAEYDQVSKEVGTASNMTGFFQGFDQEFNAKAVQRSWANGRVPLMTWETLPAKTGNDQKYIPGYTNEDISGGSFDAYLTKYAKALAANGQPMVIRLDHEMNGSWYNWSEGDAQQNPAGSYKKMWQHVHDIFEENGANKYVIWNWAPTRIDALQSETRSIDHMRGYYPGDQYVDWTGMSGYYRRVTDQPTFQTTFGATLEQLRSIAPTKKIILSEIGATETGTSVKDGQKSKWFNSLFDALADPANDDIIGFSYFSQVATTVVDGKRTTNDWRLNSRADSLAAFAEGIKRNDIDYDLQEVTP